MDSNVKSRLIEMARSRFGEILPCGGRPDFTECFNVIGTKTLFWFNTPDDSTHTVSISHSHSQESLSNV